MLYWRGERMGHGKLQLSSMRSPTKLDHRRATDDEVAPTVGLAIYIEFVKLASCALIDTGFRELAI